MYPFKIQAHPGRMRLWYGSHRPKTSATHMRDNCQTNGKRALPTQISFCLLIKICSEGEVCGVVAMLVEAPDSSRSRQSGQWSDSQKLFQEDFVP